MHTIPSCFQPQGSNTQKQGFWVEELARALLAHILMLQIAEMFVSEWANSDQESTGTYTSEDTNAL